MEKMKDGGMLSWDIINMSGVDSLFQSEGFFWLTTAVATGLAAEEMTRFFSDAPQNMNTKEIIALFNQCIRNNDITEHELEQARSWSMDNLKRIDRWNLKTMVFCDTGSLGISKGFTVYWLNFKLIELEWQQVLGLDEVEETYQFLNLVLADSEELAQIEQAQQDGCMNEDQRLFLRSHWQRSKLFWTNLYASLQLFALGLIEMRQPELTHLP